MTRFHPLLTGLAAAALCIATPALAQKGALQKIGKAEGNVDIVAWPGYIERGATDKNFDRAVELPADDGRVEDGPRARSRQHRRAEAE